jgi:hypothetical protein
VEFISIKDGEVLVSYSFNGYSRLQKVELSSSISLLEESTFNNCKNLKVLIINNESIVNNFNE